MFFCQDNNLVPDQMTKISNLRSYQDINAQYIQNSIESGRNQSEGVVATPDEIILFMINLSIKKVGKDVNQIRWYDPCSGSGKFPYQILKLAINDYSINVEEKLPEIYFSELSKDGYFATFENIKNLLSESDLCIDKYIATGRLKGFLGDALEINANNLTLLSENNITADVIIGNPPYVRSTRIDRDYKLKLKKLYPEVYNCGEDLYSYFFANATNIVDKDGLICFISPQSFMKKKSSEPLRTYLSKNLYPLCIIDLDENKIFDKVSIQSAITCLSKNAGGEHIDYYHAFNKNDVNKVVNGKIVYSKVERNILSTKGWFFSNIRRVSAKTKLLKDFGFRIRSGVRPAIKSAYVYNIGDIDTLTPELRRKTIDAKGITKWCTKNNTKELLFLTEYNTESHPKAENLLEQYKGQLNKKPNKNSWMSLRPCSYYGEMDKHKIIYPDISKELKFSLDTSGSYVLDGAFFIDSDDLVLLGILNSDFALDYFKVKCTSLGNVQNKGRLRLKKYFIEDFPLPENFFTDETKRLNISNIVREIINSGESNERLTALNNCVDEFYI